MKALLFSIFFFFNLHVFADEFPVYYVDKNRFSVKGYDIEAEGDFPFPIQLHQKLEVEQVGEVQLGGGYREILQIKDSQTNENAVFQTRVMYTKKSVVVFDAKELIRTAEYYSDEYSHGWKGELRYLVKLSDGSKMEIGKIISESSSEKPSLLDVQILPGDRIRILSENQGDLDFTKAAYKVELLRGQTLIDDFYGQGTARKPKPVHVNDPLAYTILETGGRPSSWVNGFDYSSTIYLEKEQSYQSRFFNYSPIFSLSGLTEFYAIKATKQPDGRYELIPKELRAGTQLMRESETSELFTDLDANVELPLIPAMNSNGDILDSSTGWKRQKN